MAITRPTSNVHLNLNVTGGLTNPPPGIPVNYDPATGCVRVPEDFRRWCAEISREDLTMNAMTPQHARADGTFEDGFISFGPVTEDGETGNVFGFYVDRDTVREMILQLRTLLQFMPKADD